MKTIFAVSAALLAASPATATIEVRFRDGNPWDTFDFRNSGCAIYDAVILVDLSTSIAGVLIDTAYGGAGTQDPMPAELSEGQATLAPVNDGDQEFTVEIDKLDDTDRIQVRLDVDDTAGSAYAPKVEVYGDEITGATVTLIYADATTTGTFDANGNARVALPDNVPGCELLS